MNVLYLPILEPGAHHNTAVKYKRGLYDALIAAGHAVMEWDYMANDPATLYDGFVIRINNFQPDLVLTQFHASNVLPIERLKALRALKPDAKWANWSGDSWAHSLTAPGILDMAKVYDVQLVAAPDVLPAYAEHGIRVAYWNIAVEPSVTPLPDAPKHDVVWLANVINGQRRSLMERLKQMQGVNVGIYGDWERADGNNVYNFPAGEALYKGATLALADNTYADQQNYVSNRPMQVMAAGGALLLHQHVPKMVELTGWKAGVHYIEWADADELEALIAHWLSPKQKTARTKIVKAAQKQVLKYHSYAARVEELFRLLP